MDAVTFCLPVCVPRYQLAQIPVSPHGAAGQQKQTPPALSVGMSMEWPSLGPGSVLSSPLLGPACVRPGPTATQDHLSPFL